MELAPVLRTAVSDEVYAQLVHQILTGAIAPGDPLPSERDLAETFAVNRHAIREALKRLRQVGLVLINQGGNTRVLDWRSNAGLDVLVELVTAGVVPPRRMLHDIAEMRMSVGADAVRACAERGSADDHARLLAAAPGYPDIAADTAFWTAVVDGSGNLAYRLAFNTLMAAVGALGVATFPGLHDEYADTERHLRLADLIARRRGEEARALAQELLSGVVVALTDTTVPADLTEPTDVRPLPEESR